MGQERIESKKLGSEVPVFLAASWETKADAGSHNHFNMQTLNARAVEFIAKPGRTSDLRNCIAGSVLRFLESQPGFLGAAVLTPHKEPRLVLVFSFWRTEMDCRENQWECANEIQRAVLPLVDTFSRVRTYEATFPESLETRTRPADLQFC
ncbi:MAG TPA: antibiotic biosynthesis monooxygenase [Candidatus Acidoferrum sp.]|nr:antibiotic biosynthesis monooxygenase [Candidatus Acidoferrum sp.]